MPGENCLLSVVNVGKSYRTFKGQTRILRGVSFDLPKGSMAGLLGESGSGKTTIARIITGQEKPDRGSVYLDGNLLLPLGKRPFSHAADIQYVFQDPYAALEPGYTVEQTLKEPLWLCRRRRRQNTINPQEALDKVGLTYAKWAFKKIGELSGGQRQRVAIARALIPRPRLLIADESTSMLDVETANSILDVLQAVNAETGLSVLFITHQFSVIHKTCDLVFVLYKGFIVERGETSAVMNFPSSEYTRQLFESMKFLGEVKTFV
jgi:ABC-type glutathione transport system ATPase component